MSMDSPVAILYDAAGNPLSVLDGVAIPASTPGLLAMGSDGTNSRYLLVDSAGRPVVSGAGVAGTPAGGVVSVQGVAGGVAVPISGTVTASFASVGVTGAAVPASADQIGGSDGTNLQAARIHDLDTGAGTEFNLGISLRLPGAGGSTAGGTAANPVRNDPTGTTTQPISAASLPLPTGAATETTLAARLADATFTARINTLGQKAMAASTPVVIASDQSTLPVKEARAGTATRSDVASSAASVTVLAANANRLGAVIFNDSTRILSLKFGTTASATDFTARLTAGAMYEVPFGYTGRIDGIWNIANGAARVTELTA
jgi:hypothetical protein